MPVLSPADFVIFFFVFFTSCTYAQQGDAFGCVSLCMCVYVAEELTWLLPYQDPAKCILLDHGI